MPNIGSKKSAPMPLPPHVSVRWYEEFKDASAKEALARRASFQKEWNKKRGKPTTTSEKSACNREWNKVKLTFSLADSLWLSARHQHANYPAWLKPGQVTPANKLPHELVFHRQVFRLAALNCGYGACGEILADKYSGAWLDDAFAECMRLRTDFLMSAIDFANFKLQPFMSLFEQAERADVSFLIGSATTYITAIAWMTAGGRKLVSFWHVGLYCQALVASDFRHAFKNKDVDAKKEAPDFLAIDDQNEVHMFESKGGQASKNTKVLRKALGQLANLSKVTLYNFNGASPNAKIVTQMAVRTIVETNSQFEVLAYDPPAAGPGAHLRIEFNVARGLQVLESERLFENMQSPTWQLDYGLWVREVEGTHLVLCSAAPYRDLRHKLGAYLAVRQALPNGDVVSERGAEDINWRMLAKELGSRALNNHSKEVQQQFKQALAEAKAPGELLPKLSLSLKIPDLLAQFDATIADAQIRLQLWGNTTFHVRVLPGLLIQLVDWDGDMRRRNVPPSVPRKSI